MSVQPHAFRLKPGQDLKKELSQYCKTHQLQAATLLSGIGSLKVANLRMANANESKTLEGPFEIVSLIGTLSAHGIHLHISISDKDGKVLGGHLLDGCLIHTTAEIVLLESLDLKFDRQNDPETGYKELVVTKR
ncbi:PPC domain-containing DNA-binding protein [Bdellovibrio sp. HCB337]|uniref:PPC domain-containing DNA-binding protein n=1 Tax=Bdellovibrio sp. HCB337 TaxID=3394358 RepID=UPI0039A4A22A